MRRREFLTFSAAALAALWGRARAQQGKVARIGVLVSGAGPHRIVDHLRRGLRVLGYVEGRDFILEVRYADGSFERATQLAHELAAARVDIIVAHFTPAAMAAKKATQTIPIVMAPAGAPLQTGLVKSLAQPGGNITGLSAMAAELGGKRLELLRQLIPNLTRVAVLGSIPDPFTKPFVEDLQASAARAGIRLQSVLVAEPTEFEKAFAAMVSAGAQAVVIQPIFDTHRSSIAALAARHRLPIMSSDRDTLVAGGLVSFWVDETELYARTPVFIDKILKGASPASLPIEQPTKFVLALNLKTAASLGLVVPQTMIISADEVIR
jgi:putative ABC transport system substrate-binding protein